MLVIPFGLGRSHDAGYPCLCLLCAEFSARLCNRRPRGARRRSRFSCWLLFWASRVTAGFGGVLVVTRSADVSVLDLQSWLCLHWYRFRLGPSCGWVASWWLGCLCRFILTHLSVCTRSFQCAPIVSVVELPPTGPSLVGGHVASFSRAIDPVARANCLVCVRRLEVSRV